MCRIRKIHSKYYAEISILFLRSTYNFTQLYSPCRCSMIHRNRVHRSTPNQEFARTCTDLSRLAVRNVSTSDHVPYIAGKLSARAFQRYMGRYGSDEEQGSRQATEVEQSEKASSATIVALVRLGDNTVSCWLSLGPCLGHGAPFRILLHQVCIP